MTASCREEVLTVWPYSTEQEHRLSSQMFEQKTDRATLQTLGNRYKLLFKLGGFESASDALL